MGLRGTHISDAKSVVAAVWQDAALLQGASQDVHFVFKL